MRPIVVQPLHIQDHPQRYVLIDSDVQDHVPRTDDMYPKHGFASGLFGRRTRSFGSGGSGRCVADWMALPCGFGTMMRLMMGYCFSCRALGRGGYGAGVGSWW
jgi:hypothetical protein